MNFFLIFIFFVTSEVASAEALRIAYQDKPIQVNLQIGSERHLMIEPKAPIRVGVPSTLKGKISVTTIAGQVWLLAQKEFSNEKIILQTPKHSLVLQLYAKHNYQSGAPIIFIVEDKQASEGVAPSSQCDVNLVNLARYAFQWAYAPQRLVKPHPCIYPIAYPKKQLDLMRCLSAETPLCGGGVIATPIAAWRSGSTYLSLLEVKNTLKTKIVLDPRAVAGDFKAAAFAHHTLASADAAAESITALVLISDMTLSESLSDARWFDES